ncbi:CobW family GTP-binding protein [Paracoccus aminovorans]|uniref:CobW family GTP-binding protein n=1 Tax=Paracoccus aminovorans TaxID=34004 RepID=UPI002B262D90|nr:GTP-binding protein [Paracoccus aminovorans]
MTAPLPVNLLCGYLGAGTTTLLNRLLEQEDERILLMVNDFGDIAVDAALILRRSADTIQLNNGCICCSMAGGMFQAFERALSLWDRVDRLLIEARGVAEPRRLTSFALAEPDLDCRAVVAVVDPQSIVDRLADDRIGKVAERQIAGADALFLSRANVASRAVRRRTARMIAGINPLASQHIAPDADFLRALAAPHDGRSLAAVAPRPDHRRLFASRIIDLPAGELLAIVNRHAPRVHRLKGYVALPAGPHLLQPAGGVVTLGRAEAPDPAMLNRLVAISPEAGVLAAFAESLAPAAA